MIDIELPLRTGRGLNERMHPMQRARMTKKQRHQTALFLRNKVRSVALPAVVTLTRVSAGELDDDNLQGSLKAVRDGVADAFGCDDSKRSGLRFMYAQDRCKRGHFGVKICIQPLTTP